MGKELGVTIDAQLPFYVAFGVGVIAVLTYAAWGAREAIPYTTPDVFPGDDKQ
jgi:hypothetical protein